eukprot:scaffold23137_cov66-Phaeocystis_antarctica.AAC.5
MAREARIQGARCRVHDAGCRVQDAAHRVVELRQRIGEGAAPRAVGAPRRTEQRHVHVGKAHVEKEWPPRLRCSGDHRVGVGGVPGRECLELRGLLDDVRVAVAGGLPAAVGCGAVERQRPLGRLFRHLPFRCRLLHRRPCSCRRPPPRLLLHRRQEHGTVLGAGGRDGQVGPDLVDATHVVRVGQAEPLAVEAWAVARGRLGARGAVEQRLLVGERRTVVGGRVPRRRAEVPLSDHGRVVVGLLLEQRGDRELRARQAEGGARREVVNDAGAQPEPAGEQAGARRRADGRGGVEVREAHARGGERVHVRRQPYRRLPVGAEVAPAPVVGKEQQDVRSGDGCRSHQEEHLCAAVAVRKFARVCWQRPRRWGSAEAHPGPELVSLGNRRVTPAASLRLHVHLPNTLLGVLVRSDAGGAQQLLESLEADPACAGALVSMPVTVRYRHARAHGGERPALVEEAHGRCAAAARVRQLDAHVGGEERHERGVVPREEHQPRRFGVSPGGGREPTFDLGEQPSHAEPAHLRVGVGVSRQPGVESQHGEHILLGERGRQQVAVRNVATRHIACLVEAA